MSSINFDYAVSWDPEKKNILLKSMELWQNNDLSSLLKNFISTLHELSSLDEISFLSYSEKGGQLILKKKKIILEQNLTSLVPKEKTSLKSIYKKLYSKV